MNNMFLTKEEVAILTSRKVRSKQIDDQTAIQRWVAQYGADQFASRSLNLRYATASLSISSRISHPTLRTASTGALQPAFGVPGQPACRAQWAEQYQDHVGSYLQSRHHRCAS
jgi:hypothetical protein